MTSRTTPTGDIEEAPHCLSRFCAHVYHAREPICSPCGAAYGDLISQWSCYLSLILRQHFSVKKTRLRLSRVTPSGTLAPSRGAYSRDGRDQASRLGSTSPTARTDTTLHPIHMKSPSFPRVTKTPPNLDSCSIPLTHTGFGTTITGAALPSRSSDVILIPPPVISWHTADSRSGPSDTSSWQNHRPSHHPGP